MCRRVDPEQASTVQLLGHRAIVEDVKILQHFGTSRVTIIHAPFRAIRVGGHN